MSIYACYSEVMKNCRKCSYRMNSDKLGANHDKPNHNTKHLSEYPARSALMQ